MDAGRKYRDVRLQERKGRTRSNHSFSSLSMIISKDSYETLSICCAFRSMFTASSHSWSSAIAVCQGDFGRFADAPTLFIHVIFDLHGQFTLEWL